MLKGDSTTVVIETSWWHYFWLLLFGWLLIPLVLAIWRQASLKLRLYDDRVQLETGLLRKRLVELAITDINTVEIRQSFWQRLVDIGDIRLAAAGTDGYELEACGLPRPRHIHELIVVRRRALKMGG